MAPRSQPRRSLRCGIIVLLALACVAGCGGGGGGGGATEDFTAAPARMLTANNPSGLPAAALVYPAADGKFDEGQLLQWSPVAQTASYRLQIGSSAGLADVFDSGEVSVTKIRVLGLQSGVALPAQLATLYASGDVAVVAFNITASGSDSSPAARLALARGLVLDVRNMAGLNNVPFAGTMLAAIVTASGDASNTAADCVDYANTMLTMITQMNLGVQARSAQTCLVPNSYDCHTLVELYEESSGRWTLADPTFGLMPHNAVDASVATIDDMRNATRAQAWNDITYEFATASGDSFATKYYLDYPLLFANTYASGSSPRTLSVPLDPQTVAKFYQTMGTVAAPGQFGAYALQCAAGAGQATAVVDGDQRSFACDATLAVTQVFLGRTVDPQGGAVVLAPIRAHFPAEGF